MREGPKHPSVEQFAAGPELDPQAAPQAAPENWGVAGLAINHGDVEKSRDKREKRFDVLPFAASTMFEALEPRLEQLVGANDLRPAYWLEEGVARSRAVCKIDTSGVDYRGRSGSWSGTGFLVAPSILCTNHLVLNSKDVAQRAQALFDFAAVPEGGTRPTSAFRPRPDRLFWTSTVVAEGAKVVST